MQTSDNDFISILQKPASNCIAELNSLSSFPAQLQQTSVRISRLNDIMTPEL